MAGFTHVHQNRWSGVWVAERYCADCMPGMFTAADVRKLSALAGVSRAERLEPCADGTCGQCRARMSGQGS